MEAAAEVGVNLKNGYNGELTSRQAGSVGGQMVKKKCPTEIENDDFPENSDIDVSMGHMVRNNCPIRTLTFKRPSRISDGHMIDISYIFSVSV